MVARPGSFYADDERDDVRNFSLAKSEPSCQSRIPNMKISSPSEFDAFPRGILKGDLGGFTFKPDLMSGIG